MHSHSIQNWQHNHVFDTDRPASGEARTRWVIGLTVVMMVAEILAGVAFGSASLLADGWHMGTHAAALGVTAFAYFYARRHAHNRDFTFGTGKVSALGGFASSVGLAVVALLVLIESVQRMFQPIHIRFDEAVGVAVLGLGVNLFCAYLLRDDHHGHGGHGAHHGHAHGHHDHNLRAAYLHVLADALTSLLAIAALLAGKYMGWAWLDPAIGVVGAVVIGKWAFGLLRETSAVLLDSEVSVEKREDIRQAIEEESDNEVTDLHVWRVGPHHFAAIVAVVTHEPQPPQEYKSLLGGFPELVHVTVEVQRCPGASC